MKTVVVGCGRWGSFIAWYLDGIKNDVVLYGRETSEAMQRFISTRKSDLITLPDSITLCTDLSCICDAEVIIVSINSQGFRNFLAEITPLKVENKIFVLCMKGLEIETGLRLSQIAEEYLSPSNKVAVWLGPGHVQEFFAGIPNCMVIDSKHEDVKHLLVDKFSSPLIRFYYGTDLIGNEIGAAAKNVIGIAAGFLDGLGYKTLKGALMSRGTREIARLIVAMGGNELSAYGLCHLGDYEATVFSQFSHNRQYGENFILGKENKALAEGYYTVLALVKLAKEFQIELPICNAVYNVIYNQKDPKQELSALFDRSLKNEIY